MTAKLQSKISVWVAGISSFLAWLMTVPPETQNAFIAPLIDAAPLSWRPGIGFLAKLLSVVSLIYGMYKIHSALPNNPAPPTK